MRILHLHLKAEYFHAIKSGEKLEEFRQQTDYWSKRLSKTYDEIHLKLGYPKRGDMTKTIIRQWCGYEEKQITHKHFGEKPVDVFAIKVN